MPKPQELTPIYAWRLIREALSLSDIWNYWTEYKNSILDIENTVKAVSDSSNGSKLRKVSDNKLEVAVAGTEYYSPDQRGGIFGTIYRMYFSGTTGSASKTLEAGFHTTKQMVGQGGYLRDTSAGASIAAGTYISSATSGAVHDNGTSLLVTVGTSYDDADDTYSVWVDYTKK